MTTRRRMARAHLVASLVLGACLILPVLASAQNDPFPSWNDGPAKQAIVKFVADVTKEGGPSYVPPAERVATFDNDGTLWSEQPAYVQLLFALDRVRALAPRHPDGRPSSPSRPRSTAT